VWTPPHDAHDETREKRTRVSRCLASRSLGILTLAPGRGCDRSETDSQGGHLLIVQTDRGPDRVLDTAGSRTQRGSGRCELDVDRPFIVEATLPGTSCGWPTSPTCGPWPGSSMSRSSSTCSPAGFWAGGCPPRSTRRWSRTPSGRPCTFVAATRWLDRNRIGHHSDAGSQCTSVAFTAELIDAEIAG